MYLAYISGINSPDVFSCYVDPHIKSLRELGVGCHIGSLFLSVLSFADDICLMTPTRTALQKMINMCSSYCFENGLSFNPLKSKVMIFDKRRVDLEKNKTVTP